MKRVFIFLGKGGVGKTTSSASLSFWLAERGEKVFWFSVDPAHNISDIVGVKDLSQPKNIYKNLYAQEVDVESYLKSFLEETVFKIKSIYKYLKVSGLESIFDIMRLSPGMEESAILYAIYDRLKTVESDYVVIDTPPTGLTLRILALPNINIKWINALKHWRLKILDRRSMVAHVKGEDYLEDASLTPQDDKVIEELESHLDKMRFLEDIFTNRALTKKILVLNQDRLSLSESERILNTLRELGMDVDLILINKWGLCNITEDEINRVFYGKEKVVLPFLEHKFSLSRDDLLFLAEGWAERLI